MQIKAINQISIADTYFDQDLHRSIGGILTFTETQGKAGDIDLNTPKLTILNGASIEAFTQGDGNAGKITINTGQLTLGNNSQISASTASSEAGSILINANQSVRLNQRSRLSVEATKGGIAGDLRIVTNQLSVDGKSKLSVSSPKGQAGNINIQAGTIALNQGSITAETGQSSQGDGANITLQVTDLLTLKMANESLISATANELANGGNITIDSPFIIVEKPQGMTGSDIIAKAFLGNGGKIQINALGLFGIAEGKALVNNQSNNIDASSEYGAAGIVQINQTVDPNRGLVILSTEVIDPNALIAQNPCKRGKNSEFTNAGRGGLSPGFMEDLTSSDTQVSLVDLFPSSNTISPHQDVSSQSEMRVNLEPAQGWQLNDRGQMMLIGERTQATGPQRLFLPVKGCPVDGSATTP